MNFWTKLMISLFVLSVMTVTSLKAIDIENSLSVVDQNNDENEVSIDEDIDDDTEPTQQFIPSHEWQPIRKGQVIPAGLHVRINLQTGLKEAKIMDQTNEEMDEKTQRIDKHKKVIESQSGSNPKISAIRHEIKRVLENLKFGKDLTQTEESPISSSNFRSIDEIKKDFDKIDIKMESESELLKRLIEKYSKSSAEEKLNLLSDIEYLVHSIDIAQDFVKMSGIETLLPDLNSTNSRLRAQIAFTIGSAMNANPRVQIEVLKSGALKELLLLLRYDTSAKVKKRAIFAISSLVRQFPIAQKALIEEYGGLSIFADLFKHSDIDSIKLNTKVITLLNDLLIEREMSEKFAQNDNLSQIKLKQYQQIGLNEAIIGHGFCQLVPNLLNSPDIDIKEKTIEAMDSLSNLCINEFKNSLSLLQTISLDFKNLSKSETNGDSSETYFTDLYQMTSKLINKLNSQLKDEF